jgi:hypothetical protein
MDSSLFWADSHNQRTSDIGPPDSLEGRSPFPVFSQAHHPAPLLLPIARLPTHRLFPSSPVFRHPSQRAVPSRNAHPPIRSAARSIALLLPCATLRFAPAVARARPPGFGSFRFAPSKKSLTRFANPCQPSETSHLLRLWKVKPPLCGSIPIRLQRTHSKC